MADFIDSAIWVCDVLDDLSCYKTAKTRSRRVKAYNRALTLKYNSAEIDEDALNFARVLLDGCLRGYYNHRYGIGCKKCDDCAQVDECGRYEYWRRLYPGANLRACRIRMGSYMRIHASGVFDEDFACEAGIYDAAIFDFL
jgi:hypothetical protein